MTTHSSAPTRLGARALRGALAVFVTLAAVFATAPTAYAIDTATAASPRAAATPSPTPEADADTTPTLVVAPSGEGMVTGTQAFTLSARTTNTAGGDVVFSSSATPLTTPEAVAAWLDHEDTTTRTPIALATAPLTSTTAGTVREHVGSVSVEPVAVGIDRLGQGVYPLQATFATPAGALTARSVLVVGSTETTGTVAAIVPVTAPATTGALLTSVQLAELTAPGGALRAQLDAVTGTPAILAVDPAIAAAIRVLGTTAPAAATAWLDDLLALPNPRFALQFGDADLAAQVAAGLSHPVTPDTLAPFVGHQASTEETPALEELLDIGATRPDVYWPATGTANADVVAALGAIGTDETPAITLTSLGGAPADPAQPWVVADGAHALVYDEHLAAALGDVSTAATGVDRAAAHASVSAYAAFADPDRPLLAVVDRATGRDPTGLRDAVVRASALNGRAATTLAALASADPIEATIAETDPETGRGGILSDLRHDEERLTSFATILEDPAVLTAPERAAILQLIGNAWRDDDTWADAVSAHREGTADTLSSVHLVPSSDIVLLGTNTSLVFTVRNDLKWPVSLVVIAQPRDPRLIVQTTIPVEAGAAQNTRVEIPVEARVANGETALDLRLISPAMVGIGEPVRVAVSVRAEWEGVGIVVMAVGIGALLVAGAVRTVGRLRARNRPEPDAKDADG